jgi:hypothetical protein
MTAASIEDGRLLRSVAKSGKVNRETLSDWDSGRCIADADARRSWRSVFVQPATP